ncbi:DUF5627 domain-containing protein [Bacteroides reticulotermitis]|uniref:Adhesin n=2 Tax=Bacteroides reticulotermitis TaxID=1133319 RepID=W4US94_9BACE|nr:DUF5627 domain-containing protein [Bacteroides reticulotermitis]MBB4045231.1 hypothetical protein [Bacteroides reticulotermitis]GAE84070.1 hypothetical protein JCM10512_2385 [Bacteroides reticulotermitis JCM 10512]
MKKELVYIGLTSLLLSFTACESSDNEFPDFDYQTVYFANQYGLRTIELGEDEFLDNSLDNQHRVSIKAAWGGGYTNRQNVMIDTKVDESLCENLYFKGTNTPVTPMPASYYTLASNQINIPKGQIIGGVEVQFTDAFFADKKTLDNYYVIPLKMTDVQGADSILQGKATVENPVLTNSGNWSIQPKNFVLYAVKYVNPWHGEYLRRGVDQAVLNGVSSQLVRHQQYVEKDEKVNVKTGSLKDNILPLSTKDTQGTLFNYNLTLAFAEDGSCTIGSTSADYAISGTGKFVKKGEKNSLGGKDRDAIYLDYTVDFKTKNMQYATKDTLVLSTRGVQGGMAFEIEMR